jgi:hypothetical protein
MVMIRRVKNLFKIHSKAENHLKLYWLSSRRFCWLSRNVKFESVRRLLWPKYLQNSQNFISYLHISPTSIIINFSPFSDELSRTFRLTSRVFLGFLPTQHTLISFALISRTLIQLIYLYEYDSLQKNWVFSHLSQKENLKSIFKFYF